MKRKTLNREFKELSSYTEPLELPKHLAFKFSEVSQNWTTDTHVAVICSLKTENQDVTYIEKILQHARAQTNFRETKFMPIHNAAYAMEGPFIFILMVIAHPEIETLILKDAFDSV